MFCWYFSPTVETTTSSSSPSVARALSELLSLTPFERNHYHISTCVSPYRSCMPMLLKKKQMRSAVGSLATPEGLPRLSAKSTKSTKSSTKNFLSKPDRKNIESRAKKSKTQLEAQHSDACEVLNYKPN